MKERHHLAGQGVLGASGAAFGLVAAAAGKTEIFKSSFATLSLRQNMVYGHRLAGVGLAGVAVGAVAIVGLKQPIAQGGGQIAHRLQLIGWGDLMAAPLQQRGGVSFLQHAPIKFGAELGQFGPLLGRKRTTGIFIEEGLVAVHLGGCGPVASHAP